MSVELHRHVAALVSDLTAEYGETTLVGKRIECSTEAYETLRSNFEQFGVVGGAGIRVRDGEDTLFARYDGADGWTDPGTSRQPGESYTDCAVRGVRESAGIEATVDGLAQIQLLYMSDWTDRPPVVNPYLSFVGSQVDGRTCCGVGVDALAWMDEPPERLLYEEIATLPVDERTDR